jgi:hypothetical protein
LQLIGQLGRENDLDLWINEAVFTANLALTGYYGYSPQDGFFPLKSYKPVNYVVISDGRYANEILKVRNSGGMAVKLIRNDNSSSTSSSGIVGHSSEADLDCIPKHFYTHILYNNSTLDELKLLLSDFLYANNLNQTILGTRYSGK